MIEKLRTASLSLSQALAMLWLIAAPAAARTYGVEDILTTEALADVRIAPGGRWMVFGREIPLRQADRFDFATMDIRRTRLFWVDLLHPGAAAPLFDPADRSCSVMLGFSPGGSRLAVARLEGRRWRLGVVTLANRRVQWFDLAPDYFPGISTLAWISEDELVTLAQPGGLLPWKLRQTAQDENELAGAWRDSARGDRATATAIGSGPLLDDRPPPASEQLVRLDVESGAQTLLGVGDYESLVLSPDHRHLAIHVLGMMNHPPAAPISETFDPRHRDLRILDLSTRRAWLPCPTCDVSFASQAWSADGRRLLFHARMARQSWEEGGLWIADMSMMSSQPVTLDGIRPSVARSLGEYDSVGLGWRGSTPLLFGATQAGGASQSRSDWYALDDGKPIALSRALDAPVGALLPRPGKGPTLQAGQSVWDLASPKPRVMMSGVDGVASLSGPGGALAGWSRTPRGLKIVLQGADGRSMRILARGGGDLAFVGASLAGKVAIISMTQPDGVGELMLARPHRVSVTLAQINSFLADVTVPPVVPIRHRLPSGQEVTSWLYRPASGAVAPPLIVIPYPGHVFADTPPALWNPGTGRTYTNVSALVGHGYAVLLPSMPTLPASDVHAYDFAGQIMSAVDAVLARGYADPRRLGLWGHSYGAFAAATVATESHRFQAIVASNGIYDLTSFQGQFSLAEQRNPGEGQSILFWAGWTETAQPGMDGNATDHAARYVANSPIHHVDSITTPMLIVGSDRDIRPIAQSEAMFSALYRRDKEARLVSYWGEDHVNYSPANIRDLYRRVFAWFDDHFAKLDPSTSTAAR